MGNNAAKFQPGADPSDLRFRCAACGREYWLAFGITDKKNASHRTRIGGADWCDACAKRRFKRRYKLGGGVLGERTVPEPYS